MSRRPRKDRRKLDYKILVLVGIIIGVLIIATIINGRFINNGADKLANMIDVDNGDQKINWERYHTIEMELTETLKITQSGVYYIRGSLEDGSITIDVGVDGVVKLILDNISIRNSSGPAISCYNGDDLVIELVGENYLEDGITYLPEYDEDITGAIYSKADLTFQGEGKLVLIANYQDGIVGKDDLKFNSGIYDITAKDDGVRGKDSIYIMNGRFNVRSMADAFKTTNDADTKKGFIMVKDGTFNIESSEKGLEAVNNILIYNGNFVINSHDDAIHSNNYIGLMGGSFDISSGDDGIHADKELIIDGGEIVIQKAYEGLEAQAITINDGEINIASSDDGINAGGGADLSTNNQRKTGPFDADTNCILTINGGDIYINANGDGIDSNGHLYFNGGVVVIDGPINDSNGALDASASIIMNGGIVIATGSSGMAETLGNNSSVHSISIYFSSMQPANTVIAIKNSADETIIMHTSAKIFDHLAVGAKDFVPGETYTIYINGERYQDFVISDTVTIIGNPNFYVNRSRNFNGSQH